MTKKNLGKVVENLFFTEGEFKQGTLVISDVYTDGDWDIMVEDKEINSTKFYNYMDGYNHRITRSPRMVTNLIWNEWNIKENA